MNHIQKSFLKTAGTKLIPFQTLKTNYGFSSADANDITRDIAKFESENAGLTIVNLPPSASFVAIALRLSEDVVTPVQRAAVNDLNLEVAAIASAPPGATEINLHLVPGERYYVYILSSTYNDGYISQANSLVPQFVIPDKSSPESIAESAPRRIFEPQSVFDTIELNMDQDIPDPFKLELSQTEDEWYPYAGTYKSDNLLWEDPTPQFSVGGGFEAGTSYSYLAYQRNFLDAVIHNFAHAFDIDGSSARSRLKNSFTITATQGPQNTIYSVSNFNANQQLRTMAASTFVAQTYIKWEENPILAASDEGSETINTFKKIGAFDQATFNLLTEFPPATPAPIDDPFVELNMRNALHQHLAGMSVFFEYVVGPSGKDFTKPILPLGGDFNDIVNATANAIGNRAQSLESTRPVLFEEGNKVLDTLAQILSAGDNKAQRIIAFMATSFAKYKEALASFTTSRGPGRLPLFHSPFESVNAAQNFRAALLNEASIYFAKTFDFADRNLTLTDTKIQELGDFTFIPTPGSDNPDATLHLAHEATLQNIRFLRNLTEELRDDVWTQSLSLNGFILDTIFQLKNEIVGNLSRSNTIINLTNTTVQTNDIDILYRSVTDDDWKQFNGNLQNLGKGIHAIDIGFIEKPGQYLFMIRPKGLDIGVPRIVGESTVSTPDLNDYQSKNYFYGWNIEFSQAGDNGLPLGEQRMIVGSFFIVNDQRLIISPNIAARPDFVENTLARIWPNTFVPILVDVEITEHNIETLSYANYSQREFNTKTGVLTLYDADGNIYKQWTIGDRVKEDEGFANIEFRDPIEE